MGQRKHPLDLLGRERARAICGIFASPATSATAREVGTVVEPMMASTLSASAKRRAFLPAAVGSEASSRTT
jgi:RecB family endonuclease NucS